MEITNGDVEDIPMDNDIKLTIPIFPVGLSIGNSSVSLKHLTIVERPTQPPQLASPNQVRVTNDAMNDLKELAANQTLETPSKVNHEIQVISPRDKNQKQVSPRERTAKVSPRDTKTKEITPRSGKTTPSRKPTCKEGRSSSIPTPVSKSPQAFAGIQNENTSTSTNSTTTTTTTQTTTQTTTHLQKGNVILDGKAYSWNFNTSPQFNGSETRRTKYESVKELKEAQDKLVRHMKQIDDKLVTMKEHKVILAYLSSQMKESSRVAFELKRNNQGVPFVNAVKELIKRIHEAFNNNTNKKRTHQITIDDVPFIADVNATFKTFGQVCERIILTTVNYNVTYLEDFHLMTGKIHGMIESIIALYYKDITDDEDYNTSSAEMKNNAIHAVSLH